MFTKHLHIYLIWPDLVWYHANVLSPTKAARLETLAYSGTALMVHGKQDWLE